MVSLCNGIFHSGYFDCRDAFQTVLDSYCCVKGLNVANKEA